jgi:hypothetical protein
VLQLDLSLEHGRVRFYSGSALLLDSMELAERANRLLEEQIALRDMDAGRAAHEAQRAAQLEQRLAAALADLERFKH